MEVLPFPFGACCGHETVVNGVEQRWLLVDQPYGLLQSNQGCEAAQVLLEMEGVLIEVFVKALLTLVDFER